MRSRVVADLVVGGVISSRVVVGEGTLDQRKDAWRGEIKPARRGSRGRYCGPCGDVGVIGGPLWIGGRVCCAR